MVEALKVAGVAAFLLLMWGVIFAFLVVASGGPQ